MLKEVEIPPDMLLSVISWAKHLARDMQSDCLSQSQDTDEVPSSRDGTRPALRTREMAGQARC